MVRIYKIKSLLNIDNIKDIQFGKEISFVDFTSAINFKVNTNLVLLNRMLKKLQLPNDYSLLRFIITNIHRVKIVNNKVWCVVDITVFIK